MSKLKLSVARRLAKRGRLRMLYPGLVAKRAERAFDRHMNPKHLSEAAIDGMVSRLLKKNLKGPY